MAVIWKDGKNGGGKIILSGKELKQVQKAAKIAKTTPRRVLLTALFEMAFREGVLNEEEKYAAIKKYCGKREKNPVKRT